MPKYDLDDKQDGHTYKYTLREEKVDGYVTSYDLQKEADNQYLVNITNTLVDQNNIVTVSGTKTWLTPEGTEHPTIVIRLLQNGEAYRAVMLQNGETQYSFKNLPKYYEDENGNQVEYVYTVKEDYVPGYVSIVTETDNGFDITNMLNLGAVGQFSVLKKVEGDNAPAADTEYEFVLQIKATVDQTALDANLAAEKAELEKAYADAEAQQKVALKKRQAAEDKFAETAFITTASAYQFIMLDDGYDGDNRYALFAADRTSPSAYLFDFTADTTFVPEDSGKEDAGLLTQVIQAIKELFDELTSLRQPEVFLSRLTEKVQVSTPSALAFGMTETSILLDAYAEVETAENLVQTTKLALDDFNANKGTTPSAITLIMMNEDGQKEIDLTPTVDNQYFNGTDGYNVDFTLFKDKGYTFAIKATTGTAISYKVLEQKYPFDNYEKTTVTTSVNGANVGDPAERLFSSEDYQRLTTESVYGFVFTNIYTNNTNDGGNTDGGNTGGNDGDGDTPPETVIEDPDVPLTEPEEEIDIEDPDVPLVDVPGEEVEIEEPEVPLGDAPQTGDNSNTIPFVILMLAAACGLVVTRRKFN
ncbi:MAG: Cna B-type domain-containing protein [Peptococcaceae bacterium]